MSKFGRRHQVEVVRSIKRRGGINDIALMVDEMSVCILDLEEQLKDERRKSSILKDELNDARTTVGLARAAEAHMRGYIERVKELDPNTSGRKSATEDGTKGAYDDKL